LQQQQEEDDEAYKAKYLRLKARFSKMAQDHIEEVGGLHEEIATLQERLAKTDAARCGACTCGR
jgi:aerobic-type carbon monoxide dehydrogenase small subunit (CoxS/CutS family)